MQATLDRLDKKLEQGRERFLDASPAIARGLQKTLEKWEKEREDLSARIAARSGKTTNEKIQEWFDEIQREFANSIEVPGGGPVLFTPGRVSQIKVRLPASQLRERLKMIETRVLVWFRRKSPSPETGKIRKGYDLVKVRVKASIDLGKHVGTGDDSSLHNSSFDVNLSSPGHSDKSLCSDESANAAS